MVIPLPNGKKVKDWAIRLPVPKSFKHISHSKIYLDKKFYFMTEQLIYRIYKISNNHDEKVYIGSTRLILRKRMECHRSEAKKGNNKKLSSHMRENGINNFKIELIKEMTVSSKKEARKEEQIEIEKIEKENLLNILRAYSFNTEKTRDQEKRKKSRRDYYHRKKLDPEWLEKEKNRNKLRMRLKRYGAASETERVWAKA